jgi:hypothetical protein
MKKLLVAVLAAAAAGGWVYNTFSVHPTPEGQPPLSVLDEPSAAIRAFNESSSQYRLLTLLSPT